MSKSTAVSSLARYASDPVDHLKYGHAPRNAAAVAAGERAHADLGRRAPLGGLLVLVILLALAAYWVLQ